MAIRLTLFNNKTIVATDALVSMIDLLTKNHLKGSSPNIKIVSSVSYMDTLSTKGLIFNSVFCLLQILFIPIGLSAPLSAFLYHLVVEKEERTLQLMKAHGLDLRFYFIVSYIFFFGFASLSSVVLFLLAWLALELPVFVLTSKGVLVLLLALWAHA